MTSSPRIPSTVGEVLDEFRRAHACDVRLWVRTPYGWELADGSVPPASEVPSAPGDGALEIQGGAGAELRLEAVGLQGDQDSARSALRFLTGVLSRLLKHDAEARFFGRELADRYEEITLLYSISEILGSVISLEEATGTILSEVVGTLGVQRAALWIHIPENDHLELIAAVGGEGQPGPISIHDDCSVTAAVFRERRPVILEPGDEFPREDCSPDVPSRGSFLSVPVSYTPPEGESRTIGVFNLIGRRSGERFSAGDQKLISAIASQIGAAVENSRLVAESLRRERLVRELELAHDLQLKLLPPLDPFRDYAEVAARCIPADSVGGDFYHLFHLSGGRIGVMIGDVSSHGFGAALIMALTMSAVAIHASESDSPNEVLCRTHQALIDELESTEMYMTLFYGVIDPAQGRLTYVNAGHSHAFQIKQSGESVRLPATDPPFGIVDQDAYTERSLEWDAGKDLLLLFTDGLSDALGVGGVEGERRLIQEVVRARSEPVTELLQRLFRVRARPPQVPSDDRTAVLVRI